VVRLATTGYYGRRRYDADPFVALAVARSLAAGLPPGRDRRVLVERLRRIDDDDQHPLAALHVRPAADLGRPARALLSLLRNRDPRRFDTLYAALPASVRAGVARLSPLASAGRLEAPVLLASAPHDKYFPLAESRSLARAAGHGRLTVTSTLDHAIPEPSLGDVADLVRFDGFVVRVLHSMG
jgi:pimeloyl-ACP methyl ester carboxylesterase